VKRHFKFCVQCRRTITSGELESGRYAETPHGFICADCANKAGIDLIGAPGVTPAASDTADPPTTGAPPDSPIAASAPAIPSVSKRTGKRTRSSRTTREEAGSAEAPAREAEKGTPRKRAQRTRTGGTRRRAPSPAIAPEQFAEQLDALKRTNELLQRLEQRLDQVHRLLSFEKVSTWNVVAAVMQVLAIGMLVVAAFRWLARPVEILLVAVTFQLMALTFFLRGK